MENSTSGVIFKETDLMKALYDIQDILERALCPFVVLKETAQSLVEGNGLKGDGVYIGIMKRNITKEALSTIKFYLAQSRNVEIRDDGFDYEWNSVPVHVKFISRTYKFLENQDFKFYMANEYKIPNPFSDYWKARNLVQ